MTNSLNYIHGNINYAIDQLTDFGYVVLLAWVVVTLIKNAKADMK